MFCCGKGKPEPRVEHEEELEEHLATLQGKKGADVIMDYFRDEEGLFTARPFDPSFVGLVRSLGLCSAIKVWKRDPEAPFIQEVMANVFYRLANVHHLDSVTASEVLNVYDILLHGGLESKLTALRRSHDTDHDGVLSKKEVAAMMTQQQVIQRQIMEFEVQKAIDEGKVESSRRSAILKQQAPNPNSSKIKRTVDQLFKTLKVTGKGMDLQHMLELHSKSDKLLLTLNGLSEAAKDFEES